MPSPFPGMDPYLEGPSYFPMFHGNMIAFMQAKLQKLLPQDYDAASNERTWVESLGVERVPDVNVVTARRKKTRPTGDGGTAVAVAEPVSRADPAVVIQVSSVEDRQGWVEVHVRKGAKLRLVTHIEVLSPSNKRRGHPARKAYRKKQREVLGSKVHLVEIDLLRKGRHTTAIALDALKSEVDSFDYHVCVRRFHEPDQFAVYPIELEERLPRIPIPLLPEDGEVALDLQELFEECYEGGPYAKRIDYRTESPEIPLSPSQASWITKHLNGKA